MKQQGNMQTLSIENNVSYDTFWRCAPPSLSPHSLSPKVMPFLSLFIKQTGRTNKQQTTRNSCTHKAYKNLKLGTTTYKQKTDKIKNCPPKAIG